MKKKNRITKLKLKKKKKNVTLAFLLKRNSTVCELFQAVIQFEVNYTVRYKLFYRPSAKCTWHEHNFKK